MKLRLNHAYLDYALTEEERELADAVIDESGVPETQLTLRPEEDWVRKHRLEQETVDDINLAKKPVEDIASAVELIRK